MPVEEITPEKKNDWLEVQNYTRSLNTAINRLNDLPLSSRLLKEIHAILLNNARGDHKMPGEFRTSQNWIGGATLADAKFIPPSHNYVNELMGDLENFLHNKELHIPSLIKIGIAHYQFETIHPFLDGNGRIGRLLITLFLVSESKLDKPLLYLSAFFEKNKSLYYDNLTRVREKNDLLNWLKYFLIGIDQTATQSVETLSKILTLKQEIEKEIMTSLGRRTQSANKLLVHLFQEPFVSIKQVETICDLTKKAAGDLVATFEAKGWLKEITGQSRNRFFLFERYLNLFN